MIRFCDKEVYSVFEGELNRGKLFEFFCQNDHNGDIVIVYSDTNEYKGIITYDRLLSNNNELIQTDILLINKDIWKNAKNLFNARKDIIYLPVFDEKNQLVYFCYDDNSGEENYDAIDNAFEQFELNNDCLFINELYPNVQVVCIYDMNEFAYKLYNLLKIKNIDTIVIGQKWEMICGIFNKNYDINNYPEYAQFNILAEPLNLTHIKYDRTSKRKINTVGSFNFLIDILYVNRIYIQNVMKQKMQEMGINFLLCKIPNFEALQKYSLDEFYRNKNGVLGGNKRLDINKVLNYTQLQKVKINNNLMVNSIDASTKLNIMNNLNIISRKYSSGENYIYVLGPCIVNEIYENSVQSLPYILDKSIRDKNVGKFGVISVVIPNHCAFIYKEVLESLPIKENDIILCINNIESITFEFKINYEADINLKPLYDSRPDDEEWFFDAPIHTNWLGNFKVSEYLVENYLYKIIESMNFEKEQIWLQKSKEFLTDDNKKELYKYIKSIDKFKINSEDKVGAIVMNCNPFTLGHQYLINKALEYVDYLYIFIVEENRSEFSFKDRIKLVQAATSTNKNIKVIPSGKFIISNETMPIYFEKAEKQDVIIDASRDIEIFARYIAHELGITVRFVGEEPLDNITNQYNQEMKRTLSEFDIQFIEIPRTKAGTDVISASKVRKLLESGCWNEIQKLVPIETLSYLKNRSGVV